MTRYYGMAGRADQGRKGCWRQSYCRDLQNKPQSVPEHASGDGRCGGEGRRSVRHFMNMNVHRVDEADGFVWNI